MLPRSMEQNKDDSDGNIQCTGWIFIASVVLTVRWSLFSFIRKVRSPITPTIVSSPKAILTEWDTVHKSGFVRTQAIPFKARSTFLIVPRCISSGAVAISILYFEIGIVTSLDTRSASANNLAWRGIIPAIRTAIFDIIKSALKSGSCGWSCWTETRQLTGRVAR